jgi:hypothetical protein
MSVAVKRLLLDALKPRELSIIKLSQAIGAVEGVDEVEIVVIEVDSKTETIKVTVKGPKIDYDSVSKVMKKQGVSIKGVDEISVSKT